MTWLRIDELLARAEAQGKLAAEGLGPRLHLYGVSYAAPSYHRMLAALGRHIEVFLYTLNPCREFWEDVETTSEVRRRVARTPQADYALDDPFGLLNQSENSRFATVGPAGPREPASAQPA